MKQYKRGQGSLGPSQSTSNGSLRHGTAQKRPDSPNTQGVNGANGNPKNAAHHNGHGGPSPYSFGLVS